MTNKVSRMVTSLDELVTSGEKFATVFADPPWMDMSFNELARLPVSELLQERAWLFLLSTPDLPND